MGRAFNKPASIQQALQCVRQQWTIMGPAGSSDSHINRASFWCARNNPEASAIWWTDRQTHCQSVRTPKQTPLSHSHCPVSNKPEDWLNPVCWWNVPTEREREGRKKILIEKCFCGRSFFLREWTDRLPVCTSSYLRGMHWRDLRGEKVTQVTGEAKCLDCVRGPLAMRRSFTLPCLSWSQLHWMRPAGTAPLSDNCSSGLCPGVPLTPAPHLPSAAPGLINHTYNTGLRCRQGAVGSFHNLRNNCALQRSHCWLISVGSDTRPRGEARQDAGRSQASVCV